MTHVAAVAHDAGGARALVPCVRELRRRGIAVTVFCAGPATAVWADDSDAVVVEDEIDVASATEHLRRRSTDALLSACGMFNRVEHTFRVAARELSCRSVAVIDSWSNYAGRFERTVDGRLEICRPDIVCAIDERTATGLRDAGFAAGQVVVTGAPNLEESVRLQRQYATERRAIRERHGWTDEDRVFTLFSEPFFTGPHADRFDHAGLLFRDDGASRYGYTSVDTLRFVLDALSAASTRAGRCARLVVRPHPNENPRALDPVLAAAPPGVHVSVATGESAAYWIGTSDAVFGMMSIALLEAALGGTPSISVQIGLVEAGQDDHCDANLLGYSIPVFDRSALDTIVDALLVDGAVSLPTPSDPIRFDGASAHVGDLVLAS